MKVLFVGSECVPFIKTGGLADVMGALPKALSSDDCDVRVILPFYSCIPEKFRSKAKFITSFDMDLGNFPRCFYVGILGMKLDGIQYYFIDNQDFFNQGNPYTTIANDIGRYTFFDKAVLAALPVIDFLPDVIHCHDWQAGLVPVYLRTLFRDTPLAKAKTVMTIHNLRFQGNNETAVVKGITGLPDYVFNYDGICHGRDANMLKGGIVFSDMVTTVSRTYADEIKTHEYGEQLEGVTSYYSRKLRGIVNGIDTGVYNPSSDKHIFKTYTARTIVSGKKANKLGIQKELGLVQDEKKFVIALISRLTDQKGLDLVNAIMHNVLDEHTQFILIGTGEPQYEGFFRNLENTHKGQVSANIMYSDDRAHKVFAAADAMLVPSRFEPCGLTQLMAMRYGTLPIVRETGGLKDTVEPYNEYSESGTGFSFDRYDAGLLLDCINYAKTVYFTRRDSWNKMVKRAMGKDFSWNASAQTYLDMYREVIDMY